jgi:hypothetical protein
LFRTFGSTFEASHEDDEPTLQLELIDLHCSDELRSEFKCDLLNFHKCLPTDKADHSAPSSAKIKE